VAGDAEFQLSDEVLVPSHTGWGAQFNQHLYAEITGAPQDSLADLEQKVVGLEPQLVRLFYNDRYAREKPDQLESFLRTGELAQRTGAVVNVTWQSGPEAYTTDPAGFMARFADVLDTLVTVRGVSKLRWVTIQNEPNTPKQPKQKEKVVTPDKLADLYRRLDQLLEAKGLRRQIRFMGGDLIRTNQELWFDHMAQNLHDVLDAYSVHVYWDYWQPRKFQGRLVTVKKIVDELPEGGRKPLFVTEFGVRGRHREPNKHDPGDFEDDTPLGKSTIAAFQQAWFRILAAQLGYVGTVVWDCFSAKYDKTGTLAYSGIGPAEEGWPLYPSYWALRLMTMSTDPGWQVRAITSQAPSTKHLAAFASDAGELTIFGLDARGAQADDATPEPYSIGGLTPDETYSLLVWNRGGGGKNVVEEPVVADAEGVARLAAPRRGVFALTTKHFRP